MSGRSDKVRIDAEAGKITAVRLAVKAVPGARQQKIAGPHGGALKVMVTAPPQDGAANRAICELLAELLGLPARSVSVVTGHASAWKTLRIEGLTPQEVRQRLGL